MSGEYKCRQCKQCLVVYHTLPNPVTMCCNVVIVFLGISNENFNTISQELFWHNKTKIKRKEAKF